MAEEEIKSPSNRSGLETQSPRAIPEAARMSPSNRSGLETKERS